MTQPQPSPTPTTPDKPSPSSQDSGSCSSSGSCACRSASVPPASTVSDNALTWTEPPANDSLGARLRTLVIHRDNRGNVRETFRASWFPQVPPIQQLVRSKSKPKTLRGMHLHRKQWDVWHFVKGAALVRLYYHDDGVNDFLWMGPGDTLAIPPGVSHGFYTPDGCILLYALTEEYDGTDEYGWHFADGLSTAIPPEFQEEWPTASKDLNISDRDIYAPSLSELDG